MMLFDKLQRKNEILVAGHMGCKAICPENTMISFQRAIEAGVDMIELDINITKDKHLVVMHDNKVNRTTNGKGYIHDMTLEEIKSLDAGSWFSEEFAGERVPELREFLLLASKYPKLLLNVEIKEKTAETVDMTISMLKEFNFINRCVIACFDAAIVKYARTRYKVKTQGFPDDMMKNFEFGGHGTRTMLYSVGIPLKSVDKDIVEEYRHMGIKPWAWLINDEKSAVKCKDAGIILVTSNNPAVPLRVYRNMGLHR